MMNLRNQKSIKSSIGYKLVLTIIACLLLILSLLLLVPSSQYAYFIDYTSPKQFMIDMTWFLIVAYLITTIMLYVSSKFSIEVGNYKKMLLSFTVLLIIEVIVVIAVMLLTAFLIYLEGIEQKVDWDEFKQMIFLSVLVTVFVLFIHYSRTLIIQWKESTLESAYTKQSILQWELSTLKLQLDDRFIFNNYQKLTNLIIEDQEKASLYLENITDAHRYILLKMNTNLVDVQEEVHFLEDIIPLMDACYKVSFGFDIAITNQQKDYKIPPVCLHLVVDVLINYSLKKREKENRCLFFKIYIKADHLILEHKLSTAIENTKEFFERFANIQKRYDLLGNSSFRVDLKDELCLVYLPLFKAKELVN